MSLPSDKKTGNYLPALIFVVGFRLLLTFYWLARFGGFWLESDTSRTTVSIQAVLNSGALAPAGQRLAIPIAHKNSLELESTELGRRATIRAARWQGITRPTGSQMCAKTTSAVAARRADRRRACSARAVASC